MMFRYIRLLGVVLLPGLTLCGTPRSQGQTTFVPGPSVPNPYVIYQPLYSRGWVPMDVGYGFMRGAADLILAGSAFQISKQQAELLRQEVARSKIDTRRKQIEQWLWERDNLPTLEDDRRREIEQQTQRSLNTPPFTEIFTGRALNDLLVDAQRVLGRGADAPSIDLEPALLAKIHVTTGRGNIGPLKSGKVEWPLLLMRPRFDDDRAQLDKQLSEALNDITRRGRVDVSRFELIMRAVNRIDRNVAQIIKDAHDEDVWTPIMLVDARRAVRQLRDALSALQTPDAAEYLSGKYTAEGRNVAELVQHMTKNGLLFAGGTPGTETAYRSLHRYMANYSADLRKAAGIDPGYTFK